MVYYFHRNNRICLWQIVLLGKSFNFQQKNERKMPDYPTTNFNSVHLIIVFSWHKKAPFRCRELKNMIIQVYDIHQYYYCKVTYLDEFRSLEITALLISETSNSQEKAWWKPWFTLLIPPCIMSLHGLIYIRKMIKAYFSDG